MKSKNNFSVFETAKKHYSEQPAVLRALETVESTNTLAKNEVLNIGEKPHVYLALRQTRGRGRGERTWLESEKQMAGATSDQLFLSWSFDLPSPPQPIAAPLIGLLIQETLREVWPNADWGLKPPNDIYAGKKKIAGLLIETVGDGRRSRLVAGLGLNVFSHPETVPEAGHLAAIENVAPEQFLTFLRQMDRNWPETLRQCQSPVLTAPAKTRLLQALNACQVNPQTFLEVSDRCDLVTETATLSWRNI